MLPGLPELPADPAGVGSADSAGVLSTGSAEVFSAGSTEVFSAGSVGVVSAGSTEVLFEGSAGASSCSVQPSEKETTVMTPIVRSKTRVIDALLVFIVCLVN
ncbi:MAG TPA: hypothetical protein VHO43_18825 [Ignavibacteriales bacterium]|nr:hypothetical protein [Ignavibacteriales bacterium]